MRRLDNAMVETGLCDTRSRAARAVKAGLVKVNGKVIKKAGYELKENDRIELEADEYSPLAFVSRSGLKLHHALKEFEINVNGKKCLDAGASTGGFTECLLRNGAAAVDAVDVGSGQLHYSLDEDPRVKNAEKTDIREYTPGKKFDVVCADLSFISLVKVFPALKGFCAPESDMIVLVKPQFEAGKGKVKKGVLKNEKTIKKALETVLAGAKENGFKIIKVIDSPILGTEGNREFLVHMKCAE